MAGVEGTWGEVKSAENALAANRAAAQAKAEYEAKVSKIKEAEKVRSTQIKVEKDRRAAVAKEAEDSAKAAGKKEPTQVLPISKKPPFDSSQAWGDGANSASVQVASDAAFGEPSAGGGGLGANARAAMAGVPAGLTTTETEWAPHRTASGYVGMPTQRTRTAPTGMTQAQAEQLAVEQLKAKSTQELQQGQLELAKRQSRFAETVGTFAIMREYPGISQTAASDFFTNGAAGTSVETKQEFARAALSRGGVLSGYETRQQDRLDQQLTNQTNDVAIRKFATATDRRRQTVESDFIGIKGWAIGQEVDQNRWKLQITEDQTDLAREDLELRKKVSSGQLDINEYISRTGRRAQKASARHDQAMEGIENDRNAVNDAFNNKRIGLEERNTELRELQQKHTVLNDQRQYELGSRQVSVSEMLAEHQKTLSNREMDHKTKMDEAMLVISQADLAVREKLAHRKSLLMWAQTDLTREEKSALRTQIKQAEQSIEFAEEDRDRAVQLSKLSIGNEQLRGKMMEAQTARIGIEGELEIIDRNLSAAKLAIDSAESDDARKIALRQVVVLEKQEARKQEELGVAQREYDRNYGLALAEAEERKKRGNVYDTVMVLDSMRKQEEFRATLHQARLAGNPNPVSHATVANWNGWFSGQLVKESDGLRAMEMINKGIGSFSVSDKIQQSNAVDVDSRDASEFMTKISYPAALLNQVAVFDEKKEAGAFAKVSGFAIPNSHIKLLPANTVYPIWEAANNPNHKQYKLARQQLINWRLVDATGWDANGRVTPSKIGFWGQNSDGFIRGAKLRDQEMAKTQDIGLYSQAPTKQETMASGAYQNLLQGILGGYPQGR